MKEDLEDLYWSMARVQLGLSDEEFLKETPYSFSLLLEQLNLKDFKLYRGHAQVTATLVNIHRDSKKFPEPFSELDFIPPYVIPKRLRKKPKYRELTPEQQRRQLANFFGYAVGPDGKFAKRASKADC